MDADRIRFVCYRRPCPIGTARDAFTNWMEGKTLVQDNNTTSIVAWFADNADAQIYCNMMNERTYEAPSN